MSIAAAIILGASSQMSDILVLKEPSVSYEQAPYNKWREESSRYVFISKKSHIP